jgi:hypothetical protein
MEAAGTLGPNVDGIPIRPGGLVTPWAGNVPELRASTVARLAASRGRKADFDLFYAFSGLNDERADEKRRGEVKVTAAEPVFGVCG